MTVVLHNLTSFVNLDSDTVLRHLPQWIATQTVGHMTSFWFYGLLYGSESSSSILSHLLSQPAALHGPLPFLEYSQWVYKPGWLVAASFDNNSVSDFDNIVSATRPLTWCNRHHQFSNIPSAASADFTDNDKLKCKQATTQGSTTLERGLRHAKHGLLFLVSLHGHLESLLSIAQLERLDLEGTLEVLAVHLDKLEALLDLSGRGGRPAGH